MARCSYCGREYERTERHAFGPLCSKACRYAVELPLSHAGRSFLSLESIGELPEPNVEPFHDSPIPSAMIDFMRSWIRLSAGQRDAVASVLANPGVALNELHRITSSKISYQAFHKKLTEAAEKIPALKDVLARNKKHTTGPA